MPDPRSVMKEFRLLDQKRLSEGLTLEEEARLAELRELVGPEVSAPAGTGGFDVSSAAARLRESLLPAGLRNRPAPQPELATAPAPQPEPGPGPAGEAAPEAPAEPFAALDGSAQGDADPFFDPTSLGDELDAAFAGTQGGAPSGAAGYDPAAYAADPAAAQGWDPEQPAFDPAAQAYDPNAAGYPDPNAPGYDPAAYAADPAAAQGWDPEQPAFDPAAQPYDPNAAGYADPNPPGYDPAAYAADPAAAQGWDPDQPAFDPAAQAYDPNAAGYPDPNALGYDPAAYAADPAAAQGWDPEQPAFDPAAQPYDPNAAGYADPNAPGYDPAAYAADPAAQGWDPEQPAFDPGGADAPAAPTDLDAALDGLALEAPPAPAAPAAGEDPGVAVPGAPDESAPAWHPDAPPAQPFADLDAFAAQAAEPAATTSDQEWTTETAPEGDLTAAWESAASEVVELSDDGRGAGAGVEAPLADSTEGDPSALDAPAPLPDLAADADPSLEPAPAAPAPIALDAGDAAPAGWELAAEPPAPVEAPVGEYDESALPSADLAVTDAFDALLAPEPGAAGVTPPDAASGAPGALAGEYDDTTGFSASPGADALAPGDAFAAATLDDAAPARSGDTHPEAALDREFQLESGGSFEAVVDAAAPEWAAGNAPSPWDAAAAEPAAPGGAAEGGPISLGRFEGGDLAEPEPELDLSLAGPPPELDRSAPDLGAGAPDFDALAPGYNLAAAGGPSAGEGAQAPLELDLDLAAAKPSTYPDPLPVETASAAELPPASDLDEIPTIEGEEILEEIPAEEVAAPTASVPVRPPPPPLAAAAPPALPRPPARAAAPEPVDDLADIDLELDAAPASVITGVHRVVIHTVEGQVKRGVLEDADLAASELALAPAPGAAPEPLATGNVKAIFFMLSHGEHASAPSGRKVRVTFADGRQVAGFSPDYQEGTAGFFMIPADTRTNTARIWVYRAAARAVTVS
ncbi:DUF6982 domain-containing protein [Anaeromyxobacter oryzisoli]|uniref:DUF6982 domain-containing protein n=1 Tax=Anaeromyxobacter oryzisoli TaxID=2925408 RepID=UPI001F591A47|nr:chemotaxis protein CheA [Anaeromyxobacter sp. SG63]